MTDTPDIAIHVPGPFGGLCDKASTLIAETSWTEQGEDWQAAAREWMDRWHALTDPARYDGVSGRRTAGPFGGPDDQLAWLRAAVFALEKYMEENPQLDAEDNAGTPCGILAAKADGLAACASAVDAMCSEGILPGDWAAPFRSVEAAAVTLPDPRVTANGGAAARAGWNLAAPADKVLGPARVDLMGHLVRYGIVSEVTLFGEPFLRIDFPQDGENLDPEFYRPSAVYGIIPGQLS